MRVFVSTQPSHPLSPSLVPGTERALPAWACLLVFAAAALVSRLPQLFSRNLLLEGDECILGLMGMHLAKGREFPIFFYGQKYGLSIIEAPIAAASFLIAGAGPVPLKVGMLALWSAGTAFYFLAFSHLLGIARSFWITLLLVLMPAWAATSMKAWSGYITAYCLTGVVIYLIATNENQRRPPWFLAGATSALVYFSHPLWLPSLFPIVAYFLISSRRVSSWVAYLTGTTIAGAAMVAVRVFWLAHAVESWTGPPVGDHHLLASLPRVLRQTYVNLTGAYYFGDALWTGPFTAAAAYIWFGALVLATLLQLYRIVRRQYLLWSHLLFLSVVATLVANWVLLEWRDARYVLAVNAPLAFLIGIEALDFADHYRIRERRRLAAVVLMLVLQAAAMSEFRNYKYMWWTNPPHSPTESRTMQTLVGHLRARGVTHVYAMNALLQWPITFYSREAVIARWKTDVDRYPPYIHSVDRALDRGQPVAIVGYVGYTYGLDRMVPDPHAIINVDGKYFIYFGADKNLLRRAGFRIAGP
jgi:hypothetical protein